MKEQQVTQILQEIAEQEVPANLNLWPTIRAQIEVARPSQYNRWSSIPSRINLHIANMRSVPAVCSTVLVLALAFAVVSAGSPGLRAAIMGAIREIGGIIFEETIQNPYMDEEVRILSEQIVSLSEARAVLPFALKIPTWAPEGFVLQDDVRVILPDEDFHRATATLEWQNTDPYGFIHLSTMYLISDNHEQRIVVGAESVEEVKINGQPAALVYGAWDVDSKEYGAKDLLALIWEQDGAYHSLQGVEGMVSVEDLVRMAESLQ
jgi:hypothetical protein